MTTNHWLTREWNLDGRARWLIAALVLGYLLFSRPWSQPDPSVALGPYTCSAALLTLAVLPRHTRRWLAIGLALAVPLLIYVVVDVLHNAR